MLDRKQILADPEAVVRNAARRGVDVDIDAIVQLETRRKACMAEAESFNRSANQTQKQIKSASPEQRQSLIDQGRELRGKKDAASKELETIDAELDGLIRSLPNWTHDDVPEGGEDDAVELSRGKTPIREFGFTPLDHVELGQRHGWFDFESAARVTGSGFYYLTGDAVRLDMALQMFAMSFLADRGFTMVTTPDMARTSILEGIGFNPRGPETQIYSVEGTDLNLVGTAEITLGGMYADQVIDASRLPILLCGLSHCFRTEAGAAGRATRGLYRVHQFTKVEMFAFTAAEDSDAMHTRLRDLECELFDALEVPYRVIDTAAGDLGGPAHRKFDLEAWMPGRGAPAGDADTPGGDGAESPAKTSPTKTSPAKTSPTKTSPTGQWGEVTSTSNCLDYQARRLNIRSKAAGVKGTQFVHTLNGTAVATGRAMIAVLENHQRADGTVNVPAALRPWVGADAIGHARDG